MEQHDLSGIISSPLGSSWWLLSSWFPNAGLKRRPGSHDVAPFLVIICRWSFLNIHCFVLQQTAFPAWIRVSKVVYAIMAFVYVPPDGKTGGGMCLR